MNNLDELKQQAGTSFDSFATGYDLYDKSWLDMGSDECYTAGFIAGYLAANQAAKHPLKIKQPLKGHFHANFS